MLLQRKPEQQSVKRAERIRGHLHQLMGEEPVSLLQRQQAASLLLRVEQPEQLMARRARLVHAHHVEGGAEDQAPVGALVAVGAGRGKAEAGGEHVLFGCGGARALQQRAEGLEHAAGCFLAAAAAAAAAAAIAAAVASHCVRVLL